VSDATIAEADQMAEDAQTKPPAPADYGDATWREMAVTAAEEHRGAQRELEDAQEEIARLKARVDVGTPEEWAPTLAEIRANGYPATADALELFVNRDEALRELLSYCRTQLADPMVSGYCTECGGQGEAYTDVADRLAKILDGES
jgi:hypothetical protein